MARNVAILLVPILIAMFYSQRDHEKRFPQKDLISFEQRYFEPVASRKYNHLRQMATRGRHVLMLVPARWSKDRKTVIHSDQTTLPTRIQAKRFAEADTIFYLHEGERILNERYTSKGEVKMVKVRTPFVEMLAFDRSGKCKGFVDAYAEKPSAAIVFTKEGDTSAPEILASFNFSAVHWISQALRESDK